MKRIIIVTGASSGIGREFALQLSKTRNADEIWLIARRTEKLNLLVDELSVNGKAKAKALSLDISGKKGVSAFQKLLEKEVLEAGTEGLCIDSLINNAGFGTYGTFMETNLDRQLEMIDLNVSTLTGLCHLCVPYMNKGSLLVNVASLASFIPLGNFAVYGATKAYVLSFSIALAAEIADSGIFVSTLCPGPVDTEFAQIASNGARKKVIDGRDPAAVVEHCLLLSSQGKRVAIMAIKWKLKAFLSRFVGRYFFARHSFIHEKRPSANT